MYDQIASNKRKSILLIGVFIVVIALLGYWASAYYGEASFFILAVVIATTMSLVSYYKGDAIAIAAAGAKQISEQDNQYVWHLVENLCITTGLPMPKVYLIEDQGLNAFATGRDPEHASIALTTGIISALENEELEGVISHELSHIKNYDIRLGMIVIICVGIIALLADFITRSMFWGGRRSSDNNKAAGALALIGIILAILGPLFAQLIQLAVSRKREYLADASGALATRYPEGLARALEKIAQQPQLRRATSATAHLYIANPFGEKKLGQRVATLFSTHPPIEDRIKRLRSMTL